MGHPHAGSRSACLALRLSTVKKKPSHRGLQEGNDLFAGTFWIFSETVRVQATFCGCAVFHQFVRTPHALQTKISNYLDAGSPFTLAVPEKITDILFVPLPEHFITAAIFGFTWISNAFDALLPDCSQWCRHWIFPLQFIVKKIITLDVRVNGLTHYGRLKKNIKAGRQLFFLQAGVYDEFTMIPKCFIFILFSAQVW